MVLLSAVPLFAGEVRAGLGRVSFRVDPDRRDRGHDQQRRHQSDPDHPRSTQLRGASFAFGQPVAKFFTQPVKLVAFRLQDGQPQIEVALRARRVSVIAARLRQPGVSSVVAIPQADGISEAVNRFGKRVVVSGLTCPLCGVLSVRFQSEAFVMRQVLTDRRLKFFDCRESVRRGFRHRLQSDFEQLTGFFCGLNQVAGRVQQTRHRVSTRVRRVPGDDLKEDPSQQVNVAVRADGSDRSHDHFRGHESRRAAKRRVAFVMPVAMQRESPVHHEHFAELAQHDVLWFEVAMDDSARMGERNRIARPKQNPQPLLHRLSAQDVPPRRASNLLHGVKKLTVLRSAEVVNRHDVGMVELASDDRFFEKLPALSRVGFLFLKHLDCDGPVDRRLPRFVNDADSAAAEFQTELVFRVLLADGSSKFLAALDNRPLGNVQLLAVRRRFVQR